MPWMACLLAGFVLIGMVREVPETNQSVTKIGFLGAVQVHHTKKQMLFPEFERSRTECTRIPGQPS